MSNSNTLRIVPVPNDGTGPSKTQGTQVWCGDERVKVHKLTLIAEPAGVWKAVIETYVQVDGEIVAQQDKCTTIYGQKAEQADERS